MRGIATRYAERYNVLVVYAVHPPSGQGSDDNWHGHLAPTMRRVTAEGFGEKARELQDGKTKKLEIEWCRRMIAEEINSFLASVNSDERISHESYRDRGMLNEPMLHMGNNAWQAEKRGEKTELGDKNREIRKRNAANEAADLTNEERIKDAIREANIINEQAERLSKIASGAAPMEVTPGQSQQRDDLVADNIGKMDRLTEDVSEWWMDHQRRMQDAADKEKAGKDDWRKAREDDVADADARWAQACGRYSDMRDPYGSLATAARAEGAAFRKEQEDRRQAEARESDPVKRQELQLKRHVEAADYFAITSERLAGISRVISGHRGSESEEHYRDEAQNLPGDRCQGTRDATSSSG